MKKDTYTHGEIEKAAQEKWETLALHEVDLKDTDKDPYYLLFEFPYPSGDLHIGHWYAYALTDIYARMLKARGHNVLFPIGFDAFGLPAENAAMKNGADPRAWTYENMDRMREQIKSMGTMLDWSKEIITCEPSYYQWTQWLFTKFFEHGLAERKKAPVKWCPKDQTVLANEQVVDGACERCGTEVEERQLTQWFFKITEYAERLLTDLEPLTWREEIKEAQRQWIGKSEGAKIAFSIQRTSDNVSLGSVEVFTTRPDTIFGATYLVLAPEHEILKEFLEQVENRSEVEAYIEATKRKTERERSENKEKTGVEFRGIRAINPATEENIPVFIADYVLASYGTGAVMAVPAHDERDSEFASKHGLSVRTVVSGGIEGTCYLGDGLLINSGAFTGRGNREAFEEIIVAVGGEKKTNYRMRDWLISRQRYWGCPIPIVYDPEGKPHLIPKEHLPWLLPTDVDFTPTGEAPLASSKELKERVVRIFGEGWTPEYDTLDTFVDSSWYYLRYLDSKDEHDFSNQSLMKRWLPVDRYSGGSEHTTMHLLYARFFHKALFDFALVPTIEPFQERFNRGLILGPDGEKMSKSKGNVVNPDDFVEKFGSDAVRLYLAFIGPYNEPGHYPWKLDGVTAMRKFLDRIYRTREKLVDEEPTEEISKSLAKASARIAIDGDRFKFNTAVSVLMVLLRELEALPRVPRYAYGAYLRFLAPFAPHLAEHLHEACGFSGSIHEAPWPEADEKFLKEEEVTVIVQVNGKKKGEIVLSTSSSKEDALREASELEGIKTMLLERKPVRVVYVPGRILNLVLGP